MRRTGEVFDLSSSNPLPSPTDWLRCILMSTHPHGLSEPGLSAWVGGGEGGEGGEVEATEAAVC